MLEATDIEELQVTETDAPLLKELLEEEEESEEDRVKQIVGVVENELNSDDDDKHDRLKPTEELNINDFQFYWPEMVEMTPNSPDETNGMVH